MKIARQAAESGFKLIEQSFKKLTNAKLFQIDSETMQGVLEFQTTSFTQSIYEQFTIDCTFNKSKVITMGMPHLKPNYLMASSFNRKGNKQIAFIKKTILKDTKLYIEFWEDGVLLNELDITKSIKLIYTDVMFGEISWSDNEKQIIFLAEPIEKEANSYYVENDPLKDDQYSKFAYNPDLGEKMDQKKAPTIFLYNTISNQIEPVEVQQANIYPQRPMFDSSGVIYFNGIEKTVVPLSPFCCINRKSGIYSALRENDKWAVKKETNDYTTIGHTIKQKQMMYFAHETTVIEHNPSLSMKHIDLSTRTVRELLPIKNSNDTFKGIYTSFGSPTLSSNCGFLESGNYYVFCTHSDDMVKTFVINTHTGELNELKNDKYAHLSCDLIALQHNCAIVRLCSITTSPNYYAVYINEDSKKSLSYNWVLLIENKQILNPVNFTKVELKNKGYGYLIKSKDAEPKPLCVVLHGGPHSATIDTYSTSNALLLYLGYQLLYINYRGSIGYGSDFLTSLTGNVGDYDVIDCGEITKMAIKDASVDKTKVFLTGGSHGGFLTCWMCVHSEYSKLFKAGSTRNPVCSIAGMAPVTDIPDWCSATALNKPYTGNYTDKEMQIMYNKSPISKASDAGFPLMILIGLKDKRVPYYTGKEFYFALLSHKKECKLFAFPDDSHPLDTAEGFITQLLHTIMWFEEHKNN